MGVSRALWLAAGFAALAGVVAALLLFPPPAVPAAPDIREPAPVATPPTLPPVPESPPAPAQEAVELEPLWREISPGSIAPALLPAHREEVPGRVLVEFSAALRALSVGDHLGLAVPQLGAVFDARIEETHRGPGARAFTGTLGADREQGFVLTVSARNTFAHLSTREGSYELVGNDRFGWLMATANMDRDVDYSVPDYRPAREPPVRPLRLPR